MEALFFLLIFLMIGVMGYFIMARIDALLDQNQSQAMARKAVFPGTDLSIIAENPAMLGTVMPALESNKRIHAHFLNGDPAQIVSAVDSGQADFGLIYEDQMPENYIHESRWLLPYTPIDLELADVRVPVETLGSSHMIMLIWNKHRLNDNAKILLRSIQTMG